MRRTKLRTKRAGERQHHQTGINGEGDIDHAPRPGGGFRRELGILDDGLDEFRVFRLAPDDNCRRR